MHVKFTRGEDAKLSSHQQIQLKNNLHSSLQKLFQKNLNEGNHIFRFIFSCFVFSVHSV